MLYFKSNLPKQWPDQYTWISCLFIYTLTPVCLRRNATVSTRYGIDPFQSHCEVNWGNPPPMVAWDRLRSASRLALQSSTASLFIPVQDYCLRSVWAASDKLFLRDLLNEQAPQPPSPISLPSQHQPPVTTNETSLIWYNGVLRCH